MAAMAAKEKKRYPGEGKVFFLEEMRFVAIKLHTKYQAKEGEKEANKSRLPKWEPSIDGYSRFLVDSKVVYDTLEKIVEKADFPESQGSSAKLLGVSDYNEQDQLLGQMVNFLLITPAGL